MWWRLTLTLTLTRSAQLKPKDSVGLGASTFRLVLA